MCQVKRTITLIHFPLEICLDASGGEFTETVVNVWRAVKKLNNRKLLLVAYIINACNATKQTECVLMLTDRCQALISGLTLCLLTACSVPP